MVLISSLGTRFSYVVVIFIFVNPFLASQSPHELAFWKVCSKVMPKSFENMSLMLWMIVMVCLNYLGHHIQKVIIWLTNHHSHASKNDFFFFFVKKKKKREREGMTPSLLQRVFNILVVRVGTFSSWTGNLRLMLTISIPYDLFIFHKKIHLLHLFYISFL